MANLTAKIVQPAKPKDRDYKLLDGRNLFLLVKKSGRKFWRYRFHFEGKEQLFSIGAYPEFTLEEAR